MHCDEANGKSNSIGPMIAGILLGTALIPDATAIESLNGFQPNWDGPKAYSDTSFQFTGFEIEAISWIESTNGRNLEHPLVTRGIHKNTRAGGRFGLMPLTVKDLIQSNPRLLSQYGNWLYASNDSLTAELNRNRRMDQEIALVFWKSLRKKASAKKAACQWYRGPYAPCDQLDTDPYVLKFAKKLRELNPS